MPDLNTLIANAVPAWRETVNREQKVVDALTDRGPDKVALSGHNDPQFIETVLANVQARHESRLKPHQQVVAVYRKALELAEAGLVPYFDSRIPAAHDFRVKHADLIAEATAAGRYRGVSSRDLEAVHVQEA